MRLFVKFLVVVVALSSLQSCVSKKKYDELLAAKEATDAALAETQNQVKDLEGKNAELASTLESETARLNGEIASINEKLDAANSQRAQIEEKLNMTQKELDDLKAEIDGIFAAYEDSGLSLEEKDGRLFVMTDPGVSYKSGAYGLSKDEKEALKELAETIKSNPALKILVEGHTDSDKVKEGASYRDNYELGFLRAKRVMDELVKNGVDPAQVGVVSRSDTQPTGDKETDRRTTVVADPSLKSVINNN